MISIDTNIREVLVGKKQVHLPKSEFNILVLLASGGKGIYSREEILTNALPRSAGKADSRAVDQHVSRLRKRLGRSVVLTVEGYGYRMPKGTVVIK